VVGFCSSNYAIAFSMSAGAALSPKVSHVNKEIFIPRRKHKTAAKLQRIFSQAMLLMSGGLSATAGLHIIAAQQMKQGSVAQANGFIGLALVINQKWKLDAGFLSKEFGITHVAQANGRKTRAFLFELVFKFAQLRDMLTAEDSTIVAKEDQHRRSALPQRTETRGIAVDIR
jgi:hypothetical protein